MESTTCFTNGDVSWNWAVNIEKKKKSVLGMYVNAFSLMLESGKKKVEKLDMNENVLHLIAFHL
jgi:hypothetical protein